MKKLLNIFSAITLTLMTSTSIIACVNDGGEVPNQISNQEIVDNIMAITNYEITQQIKSDSYQELKAKIIPSFIKAKIKETRIKSAINDDKLTISKIIKQDNEEFQTSDFTNERTIPDAKIVFNYDDIKNQTVTLKINIENIKDINVEVANNLSLYKNGSSDIDQALYWDNDSNNYQWNIGLQSAATGKGKDFHRINVATSLLTTENKAKSDEIKNFLINNLNLTANEDDTFNANELANYAIEMTPGSYQHGKVEIKTRTDGQTGWSVLTDDANSNINILNKYNNKNIVMATFNVKLQETPLSIFTEGQKNIKINVNNDFTYDESLYVAGRSTQAFINTLKMKDVSDSKNIERLLKLAIQINTARDSNDTSNISFKVYDEDDIAVDTLAKNVQYKLSIIFNNLKVKSNIELPLIN